MFGHQLVTLSSGGLKLCSGTMKTTCTTSYNYITVASMGWIYFGLKCSLDLINSFKQLQCHLKILFLESKATLAHVVNRLLFIWYA